MSATRTPYFSLVVPVYGVERYIMDSLADLLCQTFENFELIIVDDASPDSSTAIAKELSGGDSRVRILHHRENRGVSEARNTGIEAVCGRWLMFPDPDDRYDVDMLERVHRALEDVDPDLLMFGHTQEYYGGDGGFLYDNPLPLDDAVFDDPQAIGRAALRLEQETHLGYPWNKAYRASIIAENHLRFETVPFIEDIAFNLDYLHYVRTLATVGFSPYRYAKRVSSNLTNAHDPRYFEAHWDRVNRVRSMLIERDCFGDSEKRILGALYGRYILSTLERNCAPDSGMGVRERTRWIEDLYSEELFCELIPFAEAEDSKPLALCLSFMKAHNTAGLLAAGRGIHIVRSRSTSAYTKARSKR